MKSISHSGTNWDLTGILSCPRPTYLHIDEIVPLNFSIYFSTSIVCMIEFSFYIFADSPYEKVVRTKV